MKMQASQSTTLSLTQRLRGALLGAAIGAKLGAMRLISPESGHADSPADMLTRSLQPAPADSDAADLAMVDVGVRTFLAAGGRATPEDLAPIFRDHDGVATPLFSFDGLHTIQELLKEGMPARISGMGACLNGYWAAAMPAVGAYHFAHPDTAYLDGVELASVGQPRLGADWAGLAAAAVAAAFAPEATGSTIVDRVLDIAFEHNRDLFYELDMRRRLHKSQDESAFLAEWHRGAANPQLHKDNVWHAYNPCWFILPAVERYLDKPRELLGLLVSSPDYRLVTPTAATLGGAMAGAAHGEEAFPAEWRAWAEPLANSWMALVDVVTTRLRHERKIVAVIEELSKTPTPSGDSLLLDKVRGCLLAGAIGNAMGSPVEGRSWQEIDNRHPGGIMTVLDPSRLESEDDNQMAMHLVETYLRLGGRPAMARDFGQTWLAQLNRHHFYPFCMGHAYERLRAGDDPRLIGHWSVVTGSTVMCMEPVGIYRLADPEFARIEATAISYMYQRGLDVTAAAILSAAVAEAFRPLATVESICAAALAAAPTTPLRTFDQRPFGSCRDYLEACLEVAADYDDVLAVRPALYERCLLYHMIDPLEVIGFSLAIFQVADGNVREAAIGGTNIGRDSDTISGRAAMLSGLLRGAGNVPAEWVAMFGQAAIDRIDQNANQFASLIHTGPLARMKSRLQLADERPG